MYSVVLMAAMATTAGQPGWGHCNCPCYSGYAGYGCYSGYGSYSGYGCYSGYAGYGCYGCSGCSGCTVQGYGFAGGCYGYHGGCYGGWGIYTGEPYLGGCTGCYGCYGGHACYGTPVPVPVSPPLPPRVSGPDQFPPINPPKTDKPKAEEVAPPMEKKKEAPKKVGAEQVRAKVRIEIPEGGKLFVDGQPIQAAGARTFQTPMLNSGETYFYDIRIEVDRQGAIRSEERRVIIRAGEEVAVDFPNLRPTATQTARSK